jgi:hypothetical protein
MSKNQLKKELQKLTKEQLIEQIIELYDSYKPVKEYYQTFLNPGNIQAVYEKQKAVIVNEFYPKTKYPDPKLRFSVAKKAIADFGALKPPAKLYADLLVTLVENACQFTYDFGDMSEQFYNSAVSNFERALKFLKKERLLDDFRLRCEKCLEYAEPCGYGFPDEMEGVFDEYYK